jgi:uncharacterized protein YegL/ABC-type molybdate transport system substrate-binding protein
MNRRKDMNRENLWNEGTFQFVSQTVLFLVAPLILGFLPACNSKEDKKSSVPSTSIRVVHTPETELLLKEVAEKFLSTTPSLSNGSKIEVSLLPQPMIEGAHNIARGKTKTDLWLAPSRSALSLVNNSLTNLGPKQIDCQIAFSTPTIVVVRNDFLKNFDPMREGVIPLRHLLGESELILGSKNKRYHGLSEFRLAHANPRYSTAGVAALLNLTYLSLDATSPSSVTLEKLRENEILPKLQKIEENALRYSPYDQMLLAQLVSAERVRPHFVMTTRQQFKLFLQNEPLASSELTDFLLEEGTYLQDYYLCTSDADWVTQAKIAAIKQFAAFLNSEQANAAKAAHGFDIPGMLKPYTGDDTQKESVELPVPILPPAPSTRLDDIVKLWELSKRPIAVSFVLDLSGSMGDSGLPTAQASIAQIVEPLTSRDSMSLITFSTEVEMLSSFADSKDHLLKMLRGVIASGGSALYDAVRQSVDLMTIREKLDGNRLVVFFITDGNDKNSRITLDALRSSLARRSESHDLTVIGIGLKSEETNHEELQAAVLAAGGVFYHTVPEDMGAVVEDIRDMM